MWNIKQPSNLTSFITDNIPKCKVVISTPFLRADNGKAELTEGQHTSSIRYRHHTIEILTLEIL